MDENPNKRETYLQEVSDEVLTPIDSGEISQPSDWSNTPRPPAPRPSPPPQPPPPPPSWYQTAPRKTNK